MPLATRHKSSYYIFVLLKFRTVFDFRRLQSHDRLFTFHTFFSFIKNPLIKNCRMLNICALRKTHKTFFTLFFTIVFCFNVSLTSFLFCKIIAIPYCSSKRVGLDSSSESKKDKNKYSQKGRSRVKLCKMFREIFR